MKPLMDLIFASEKRMNLLLMLHDGRKEITTLTESLDTTRTALLPQTKILNEKHLIRRVDDSYELTTLGKLIVDRMLPLTEMATLLSCEWDYLGTHYLDFIPPDLLRRTDELGECYVVETTLPELFD
ncbi:helix-turn-helix transcriptional regulator, partial [Methanomethylovorans sp.]|uniref:helix-turn-helix transcriptional regulator n=1 Tax=Methanomethylovorans sp. TaxID=2758717 RepID=UPI00351BEF30